MKIHGMWCDGLTASTTVIHYLAPNRNTAGNICPLKLLVEYTRCDSTKPEKLWPLLDVRSSSDM